MTCVFIEKLENTNQGSEGRERRTHQPEIAGMNLAA